MNEDEILQAIKIMEKLMEHPITKLFNDNKNEGSSPSSTPNLSIIKINLQNGIISISDWKNQVDSCFSNSTNFSEKQIKFFPIISKECKKIFERLIHQLNNNKIEDWCSKVSSLHTAQINLARHPPNSIISIAIQSDDFKKIDNEKIIPLSLAEIKAFQQAITLIKSEDTLHGLVNIVTELQPEIKPTNTNELNADLMKLDIKTVRALRDYLKVELEKQGDHYPS